MKLQKILNNLDTYTEEEREKYLLPVIKVLTEVTKQTLYDFQNKWFAKRREERADFEFDSEEFEKFKKEQNRILRKFIEIETSEFGKQIREVLFNLKELTMDTEIIIEENEKK